MGSTYTHLMNHDEINKCYIATVGVTQKDFKLDLFVVENHEDDQINLIFGKHFITAYNHK